MLTILVDDSVLKFFQWLQGCLGELAECKEKIVDD